MSEITLQPSEIHTHQQHTKGKLIGQKTPVETQGSLVNPGPAPAQ